MLSRPIIVTDRDIPFIKGVFEPYAEVLYIPGTDITAADVRNADVLITRTRTICNESLLEESAIKLIATATIGYDHIDIPYCTQRGIKVSSAAGCNARAVLQYVVAALSSVAKKDGWRPEQRTLGVVGVGNVGSLVAQYGRILGFNVLCCDPPLQRLNPELGYVPLDKLLSQADIVTLHIPLNRNGEDKTERLADSRFFAQMRHGATFINSSRGAVIDDNALREAILSGKIKNAVIDTWNNEPDLDKQLLKLVSLATPHIAGYSICGKASGTAMVVRAVASHLGLQLGDWYPEAITPTKPNLSITWNQVLEKIPLFFDIEKLSEQLKKDVALFEGIRNNYNYRNEFF